MRADEVIAGQPGVTGVCIRRGLGQSPWVLGVGEIEGACHFGGHELQRPFLIQRPSKGHRDQPLFRLLPPFEGRHSGGDEWNPGF